MKRGEKKAEIEVIVHNVILLKTVSFCYIIYIYIYVYFINTKEREKKT